MNTITDVVKMLGKEAHKGIKELVKHTINTCELLGIEETKGKKLITEEIVNRIIRNILSDIKLGKGKWSNWSYRYGKNYIKLYDMPSVDVLIVNKHTLEEFEYKDSPKIKVCVNPQKEDVSTKVFYKDFDSFIKAKEFFDNEESTVDICLFVGKLKIPLGEIKKT